MWSLLKRDSRGAEVGNWQRFLRDVQSAELTIDEHFGPLTESETKTYQREAFLAPDGVVGPKTRERAQMSGFVPFIQAKNYTPKSLSTRDVRVIVIHTMESSEKPGTAEHIARWFANERAPRFPAPRASAHYCIDPDETVQCVRDLDVAWGAPGRFSDGAYVNDHALHIEHAGLARQTATEWADGPSRLILWRSAKLARDLCKAYHVPIARIGADELRAGRRGITGHVDLSKAFGGDHWDPGRFFPWEAYLAMVRE